MNRGSRIGLGARCAVALAAVTAVAALTAASATAGVGQKCPGTFRVLHNDKIDGVPFRAGNYVITVKRMACQQASDYFRQFLANNQNDLPKGWRLFASRLKFKNNKQNIAFRVRRARRGGGGGGGGGGGSTTGRCPGTFRVLHNDRIDNLAVPAGRYTIKVKRMSCQQASDYFARFLAADGVSKGWRVIKAKRKFRNRKQNIAFRIFPAG